MAKIITENFKVETTKETFSTFDSPNSSIAADFLSGLDTYVTQNAGVTLSTQQKSEIQDIVEDQLNTYTPENSYYIMGSSIDKPNVITNTQYEKREFQRRVIFGNKITNSSIRYMFYKNPWTTGTIYQGYDDKVDYSTRAVLNTNVVTVQNTEGDYDVFRCLEANGVIDSNTGQLNRQSTSTPTFASIDPNSYEHISVADGYIWKYMFTVRAGEDVIFGTSDSLPLPYPTYGDASVIAAAKEEVSQIIIEDTVTQLFNNFRFGPSTDSTNASDVTFRSIEQTTTDANISEITIRAFTKDGFSLYTALDSYKEMYLLRLRGAPNNDQIIYDVLSSETVPGNLLDIKLKIYASDGNTASNYSSDTYQLVPKIHVTRSTASGTPCVAYGTIDQFGTLKRIQFVERGSEYKFATATLGLPSALVNNYTSQEAAQLRCVISPRGGHGSDPINELGMSRLAVITNFTGEDILIPDANSYTKVGLIKNPTFTDATLPTQFDNRSTIVINGSDATGTALPGYYIQQTVNLGNNVSETITARIHESVFSGGNTTIYLVDYYGDFQSTFQTGIISVKANLTTTTASTLTINNASNDVTYGKYSPYSGQVLHFVDFDPIQRQATRKEKIKFIFDF